MQHLEKETLELIQQAKEKREKLIELLEEICPSKQPKTKIELDKKAS